MSEMVERVARAIKAKVPYGYGMTDAETITYARAAIQAMKLDDLQEGVPDGIAFEDAFFGEQTTVFHAMRDAWNATVDAALSIPKQKALKA